METLDLWGLGDPVDQILETAAEPVPEGTGVRESRHLNRPLTQPVHLLSQHRDVSANDGPISTTHLGHSTTGSVDSPWRIVSTACTSAKTAMPTYTTMESTTSNTANV